MSRPDPESAARRTAFVPASPTAACSACPWRTENHGKRNAGGWYTKANLRRLWAGLRRGERMSCHPTDPAMNGDPGQPREVPAGTTTRECTGSLVLIQRELQRVEDALRPESGSWNDYRAAHPRGLTREGAYSHAMELAVTWPGELPVTHVNLNIRGVSHPDLTPWVSRQKADADHG